MSVHYKFKTAIDYSTITFDGIHITVSELKKEIIDQKRLGKTADFDLKITNADTNEEYADDKTLVPKNTSVIVARVPISDKKKASNNAASGGSGGYHHRGSHQRIPPPPNIAPSAVAKGVDLSTMEGTEEEKIKAMMNQSTAEYDPSRYQRFKGSTQQGRVPDLYRCYKCNQMGHWIKNCPLNLVDSIDIKKSTGIPRSFMVVVDSPDVKGALITPEGRYAVPAVDHAAYSEKKSQSQHVEIQKPKIPDQLLCGICQDLLTDALLVPCCANSYCDDCIRNALLESDEQECPGCHEKNVSPASLFPNRFLRTAVNSFKNETGYSKPIKIDTPKKNAPPVVDLTTPSTERPGRRRLTLDELIEIPEDLFPHSPRKVDPESEDKENTTHGKKLEKELEKMPSDIYDFNDGSVGSIPSPFATISPKPVHQQKQPSKEKEEQVIRTIGTRDGTISRDREFYPPGPPPTTTSISSNIPSSIHSSGPPPPTQHDHHHHPPPSGHPHSRGDYYRPQPKTPLQIGPLPTESSRQYPPSRPHPHHPSQRRERDPPPPGYGMDRNLPLPPPLPPGVDLPSSSGGGGGNLDKSIKIKDHDNRSLLPIPSSSGGEGRNVPPQGPPPFNPHQPPPGFSSMSSSSPHHQPPHMFQGTGGPPPPSGPSMHGPPSHGGPPPNYPPSHNYPPNYDNPSGPGHGPNSGPPPPHMFRERARSREPPQHGPPQHGPPPPLRIYPHPRDNDRRRIVPRDRMDHRIRDRPAPIIPSIIPGAMVDPLTEFEKIMMEKDRRKKLAAEGMKRSRSRSPPSPSRRSFSPYSKRSRSRSFSRSPSPKRTKRIILQRRRNSFSRSISRSPLRRIRSRSRSRNRSTSPFPPTKRRSPNFPQRRAPPLLASYSPSPPPQPRFPLPRKEKDDYFDNRPRHFEHGPGPRPPYFERKRDMMFSREREFEHGKRPDYERGPPRPQMDHPPPHSGRGRGEYHHGGPPPHGIHSNRGEMLREREMHPHRPLPPNATNFDYEASIVPPGTEPNHQSNQPSAVPSLFDLKINAPPTYNQGMPPNENLMPPVDSHQQQQHHHHHPPPFSHGGSTGFKDHHHHHERAYTNDYQIRKEQDFDSLSVTPESGHENRIEQRAERARDKKVQSRHGRKKSSEGKDSEKRREKKEKKKHKKDKKSSRDEKEKKVKKRKVKVEVCESKSQEVEEDNESKKSLLSPSPEPDDDEVINTNLDGENKQIIGVPCVPCDSTVKSPDKSKENISTIIHATDEENTTLKTNTEGIEIENQNTEPEKISLAEFDGTLITQPITEDIEKKHLEEDKNLVQIPPSKWDEYEENESKEETKLQIPELADIAFNKTEDDLKTDKKVTNEVLRRAENVLFQKSTIPLRSEKPPSKRKVYVERLNSPEKPNEQESFHERETKKDGSSFQVTVALASSATPAGSSSSSGKKERLSSKISEVKQRSQSKEKPLKSLLSSGTSGSKERRSSRERQREKERKRSRSPVNMIKRPTWERERRRRRSLSRDRRGDRKHHSRSRERDYGRKRSPLQLFSVTKKTSRSRSRERRGRSPRDRGGERFDRRTEGRDKRERRGEDSRGARIVKESPKFVQEAEPSPPGVNDKPFVKLEDSEKELLKKQEMDTWKLSNKFVPIGQAQEASGDQTQSHNLTEASSFSKPASSRQPVPLSLRKQKGRINIKLSSTSKAEENSSSSSSDDDDDDEKVRTSIESSDDERKKRRKERKEKKKAKRRRSNSTSSSSSEDQKRKKSKKKKKKKSKKKKK